MSSIKRSPYHIKVAVDSFLIIFKIKDFGFCRIACAQIHVARFQQVTTDCCKRCVLATLTGS